METQVIFVRNLPKDVEKERILELFGVYGTITQLRIGNEEKTVGTAFVVYKSVEEARNAIRHMNGYYMDKMYLSVGYWRPFDKFRWMMKE